MSQTITVTPEQFVAFNEELLSDPSAINTDTHGAGWLFEMVGDPATLMSAEEYHRFLGPALDAQRLAGWPLESLVATIHQGRPGTPMPGWASMLSLAEATWIAQQLQRGFPQEQR